MPEPDRRAADSPEAIVPVRTKPVGPLERAGVEMISSWSGARDKKPQWTKAVSPLTAAGVTARTAMARGRTSMSPPKGGCMT